MMKFLDYISNNKNAIMFGLGVIVAFMFMQQCNRIDSLKNELQIVEERANRNLNNLLASQDTIRLERNINGDLVSEISSFEYEVETLTQENKDLLKKYQLALNLNEEYKDINNLISAELEVKDSIISAGVLSFNNDTITVDVVDNKKWDKYNWRDFKGQVNILKDNDSTYSLLGSNFRFDQGISLRMAIVNDNGIDMLKVTSPYPNLAFTNIENINLVNDRLNFDRKVKKGGWSLGFGVGYGINLNNQQLVSWGPSIGIGLYYSPKWLRF